MSYSVLLVDDDQRIRMGLAKHINWGRLGYNSPILAADVSQARQALLANRVDILVTDIRLPDESGLEFCRQVRSMYPDMPIFILSAFSDFEYAREAIRFGVKHYFTKPTDLQAFHQRWPPPGMNWIKKGEHGKGSLPWKSVIRVHIVFYFRIYGLTWPEALYVRMIRFTLFLKRTILYCPTLVFR